MSDRIAPAVAVTGATRGIGRAIAVDLATRGWNVLLLGRDTTLLDAVAGECSSQGSAVSTAAVDVRSAEGIEEAFARAESSIGPLTALVNNAGAQHVGPALELSAEHLDDIVDTNLKGSFLCAQAFARRAVSRDGTGAIVNVSSAAAIVGTTDRAAYAASKAGILMLTRTLAREWAPHRIRVNAIAPTFVDTELGRKTLADTDRREAILHSIPMKRIATYDDILPAVRFLLNDTTSGYITGQTIAIDGGLSS